MFNIIKYESYLINTVIPKTYMEHQLFAELMVYGIWWCGNICYSGVFVKSSEMSVDEDNELRELVSQTLESNGILAKIRVSFRNFIHY